MASPFTGKTFTFTQPDGSEIQLRGWGDQHYAVFETLDGYTVVKNPATGFYQIAQLSSDGTELEPVPGPAGRIDRPQGAPDAARSGPQGAIPRGIRVDRDAARARGVEGEQRLGGQRWRERRERRRSAIRGMRSGAGPMFAPPQRATVGDFVGLCLLIDFSDEPGTISRDEVDRFCNQQGYSGFGNSGSVRDYFFDNSIGRLRYTNIVMPYYRAQHPKTHYTDPSIPQGTRARQLIVEALNHWKGQGVDFSALTADSGGFVFAMNVYYAGEVVNNWAEGLWPHAWHLATPVQLAAGKSAFDYQFTDMSHQLTLGTFCHENGHMLCDYPDLYDYGYESSGVGAYCLMCAGGNVSEKNPVHISAYLKRLSGWASEVKPIEHDKEIALTAGANEFAMLAKDPGEYFIVENRRKTGRDVALPDEGLAIWHVDEGGNNSNEQMSPSQHYELSLEQADGVFQLEKSRNQFGDAKDLYGKLNRRFADSTAPHSKWWNGTASNLDIFDISDVADVMRFRAKLFPDTVVPNTVQGESTPNVSIPDNKGAGISDVIQLAENATISGVKVTVDISHSFRGDLQVTLLTPWGDSLRLHERGQGGSADDLKRTWVETDLPILTALHGRSTQGDWRLLVQDLASGDVGTLNRWALAFTATAAPGGSVVIEEAPGAHIPDNNPVGITRSLSANGAAGSVASLEVSVDITHTFIGDLLVALQSPAGTEVTLHNGAGGSADDIHKTYTQATTPGLAALAGAVIEGDWKLKVSDRAGQDVGKLNSWRVVIQKS